MTLNFVGGVGLRIAFSDLFSKMFNNLHCLQQLWAEMLLFTFGSIVAIWKIIVFFAEKVIVILQIIGLLTEWNIFFVYLFTN